MNNNKGFSLIEILIALLITSIILSGVAVFLQFGYESFDSNARYTQQQYRISNAIERIGKDLEKSSSVTVTYIPTSSTSVASIKLEFTDGADPVTWRFTDDSDAQKDDRLDCKICPDTDSTTGFTTVINRIKTPESKFIYNETDKRLVLVIKPVATNTGKFQGYNMLKAITTEYSVKYKNVIY